MRGNANGSGEKRVGEGVRRLTTTREMKIGLETGRVNELAIRRQYGRVDGCDDRQLLACPSSASLISWPGDPPRPLAWRPPPSHKPVLAWGDTRVKGPPGRKKATSTLPTAAAVVASQRGFARLHPSLLAFRGGRSKQRGAISSWRGAAHGLARSRFTGR